MQGKGIVPETIPLNQAIMPGRSKQEVLTERLSRLSASDYAIAIKPALSDEEKSRLAENGELQKTRELYLELNPIPHFLGLA